MANQVSTLKMEQKFKKTPAGIVPIDWDVERLGDICDIAIGGTPSRKVAEYWDRNLTTQNHWVSISDMRSQRIRATRERLSELGIKHSNAKLVRKGTVLMSFKLTIGKMAISDVDLYTNEAIAAFEPHRNILSDFLYYALPAATNLLETDTAVKGKTLNKSKLLELLLPLPPIEEQRKIAKILSAVDSAIEKTATVLQKTRMIRNALVHLTFNSDATHGKTRSGHRTMALRLLCELITKGTTPTTYGFEFTTSGVRFIKVENIGKDGRVLPSGITYISEETHRALRRSILKKDDILFSIAGALGRSAIVSENILPANTNQAVAIIRLNKEMADPSYVRYYLDSDTIRERVKNIGTQGAQINLSLEQVGSLPIPLPPLAEQRRIAGIIVTLDDQIDREMCVSRNLERMRLALMPMLLTGKIRTTLE